MAIANAEQVTREQQDAVLVEFKAAFLNRPLIHPAGPEAARELLERTLDQNDVEPMQQRIDDQVQAGAFGFLHNRHPDDIRHLIFEEHPQTIAVVAAQLPPSMAAQVLAGFGADRQADILARLAQLGPTNSEALDEIAASLEARMGQIPKRTGGVSRAADVLREATRPTSRSVLKTIDQRDAVLAESLRESLFTFNDLGSLNDETLKVILEQTADSQWAVALKGSSESLRQRVFKSLSPGMVQGLKDEMSSAGPLRLSEITSVQHQIAEAILMLDQDGQIQLPKRPPMKWETIRSHGRRTSAHGPN